MYIYNVTTNVAESIHDQWLHWMKSTHIPAMLATGKFIHAKMSQVMIDEEMGGVTYAVQYTTDSIETLQEYYNKDAARLRDEAMRLFKDKIVAFRTELKVISEQFSTASKINFMSVRAKKHLGQHFLKDELIAQQIADSLTENGYKNVLEIGPGMGVLTKYLLKKPLTTYVIEIDTESVEYLQTHYLNLANRIISKDFLKINLEDFFGKEQVAIIGNFPYNISTQIVFKTLENRHQIPEFSGMFQKEVAQRIVEKAGSKVYGILSVLTQAFYDVEYLFTVPPTVFNPPPKVDSGVIRLIRKENYTLPVDEKLFFKVVKTAFQQRRKTLRNSLKTLNLSDSLREDTIFAKRPEQLSVQEFINLTSKIEKDAN